MRRGKKPHNANILFVNHPFIITLSVISFCTHIFIDLTNPNNRADDNELKINTTDDKTAYLNMHNHVG